MTLITLDPVHVRGIHRFEGKVGHAQRQRQRNLHKHSHNKVIHEDQIAFTCKSCDAP